MIADRQRKNIMKLPLSGTKTRAIQRRSAGAEEARGRQMVGWRRPAAQLPGELLGDGPAGGRDLTRALTILPDILSSSQPAWQAPIAEATTYTSASLTSASGTTYLDVYAPASGAPPVPGSREGMLMITASAIIAMCPRSSIFSRPWLARASWSWG